MKLPVKPKDERDIIDDDNCFVCFVNTTEDRDYIVQAINCHEKLINALNTYGNHLPKCKYLQGLKCQIIDDCDCGLEQALKEADIGE